MPPGKETWARGAVQDIDRYEYHANDGTVEDAYYQEHHGGKSMPGVKKKADGSDYRHDIETRETMNGLVRRISELRNFVNDSRLSPESKVFFTEQLLRAERMYFRINYYMNEGSWPSEEEINRYMKSRGYAEEGESNNAQKPGGGGGGGGGAVPPAGGGGGGGGRGYTSDVGGVASYGGGACNPIDNIHNRA